MGGDIKKVTTADLLEFYYSQQKRNEDFEFRLTRIENNISDKPDMIPVSEVVEMLERIFTDHFHNDGMEIAKILATARRKLDPDWNGNWEER